MDGDGQRPTSSKPTDGQTDGRTQPLLKSNALKSPDTKFTYTHSDGQDGEPQHDAC